MRRQCEEFSFTKLEEAVHRGDQAQVKALLGHEKILTYNEPQAMRAEWHKPAHMLQPMREVDKPKALTFALKEAIDTNDLAMAQMLVNDLGADVTSTETSVGILEITPVQ